MFRIFLLLLALFMAKVSSFDWEEGSLHDRAVIVTCSGGIISLPWNYILGHDERIDNIKWLYHADGRADEGIAVYSGFHFVAMPAFSGRVQWTGQAGIRISQPTVLETGNYTVEIAVEHAGTLTRQSRTVFVKVRETPETADGRLQVKQASHAVYDVSSGEWRVQLTCGNFTALGQPPVDVVWTSPEGEVRSSSSGPDNGHFVLVLPSPPSGGNYTCSLPPSTDCLPSRSPLLEGARIVVDDVKASLSLLEARHIEEVAQLRAEAKLQQEQFLTKTSELKANFENKTKELQTQLDSNLSKTRELETQQKQLQSQLQATQTQLDNKTHQLEAAIQFSCNCSNNKATTRVSFHSFLASTFTGVGTIAPYVTPEINEGNGFNETSGFFTAPVSGTYFFTGSASTHGGTGRALDFSIEKDGSGVAGTWTEQYDSYDVSGTVSAVFYITAGLKVWLHSESEIGFYDGGDTSFSGFLINAH